MIEITEEPTALNAPVLTVVHNRNMNTTRSRDGRKQ